MLSITNLLCGHHAGNEALRYGHSSEKGAPRPVVVWAITKACNLRCVHCYASAEASAAPGELDHQEGRLLLDDLRGFGVPAVLFSGGEPLARPDALELMAYARSIGLNATLSTNGTLIDDAMADALARIDLRYAGISIDGARARHDQLRGQPGAYDASIAAIRRCRERGIRTGVRFTVHALNQIDLEDVIGMCAREGVNRLCIYHLAYAGRGGRMQRVDLSPDQTRRVVDRICASALELHRDGSDLEVLTVGNHADAAYLLTRLAASDTTRESAAHAKLAGSGGNRSGCNIASIDPLGNVHYDQFSWHYDCGNVRDQPFSRIWSQARDPRLAVLRDRATHLPERCRSCRFLDVCNGNLRTRAEAATGNWLGEDPACYLTATERAATIH